MKLFYYLIFFLLSIAISSCGAGSDSSGNGDKATSTSSNSDTNKDEEVKNLNEALNKTKDAFKDLMSNDEDENGEKVEVVNWRELRDLLPNRLGSLKLEDTEGQTSGVLGYKISNASGKYKSNDANMDMSIVDFGGVSFLVKTVASWSELEIDSDSSDGYQRSTEYKGYKAFEQYDEKNESGSFAVLVEDRFVVTANGKGVDMDDLKDAVDEVGIKKLARKAN